MYCIFTFLNRMYKREFFLHLFSLARRSAFYENILYKDLLNQDPVCEISPEEYSKIMEKIEGCSFDFSMLLIANAPSPSFDYSGYILYVEYLDGESSVLDNRTRRNLDAEGLVIAPDRYCLYGYSEEFNNLMEELAGNNVP